MHKITTAVNMYQNLQRWLSTCTNRPYFPSRSTIWRHHRVPWPRFPIYAREFRRFRHK